MQFILYPLIYLKKSDFLLSPLPCLYPRLFALAGQGWAAPALKNEDTNFFFFSSGFRFCLLVTKSRNRFIFL